MNTEATEIEDRSCGGLPECNQTNGSDTAAPNLLCDGGGEVVRERGGEEVGDGGDDRQIFGGAEDGVEASGGAEDVGGGEG